MAHIVVDDRFAEHLKTAIGLVKLVDSQGHALGVFAPEPPVLPPDFDEEEFIRQARESLEQSGRGGRSTQEVLDRLSRMEVPQ